VNWSGLVTEAILTAMRLAAGGIVGGVIGSVGSALRRFFDSKDHGGSDKDVSDSIQRASTLLHRDVVERTIEQVKAIDQFLERYQSLMKWLGSHGKRMYIMVDDLDRCLPDEALGVFEAIKLFLDAPECRYVVAIDRAMIRRGLAIRYEKAPQSVDPDEYIEKTISLSIDLPQWAPERAKELLHAAGLNEKDTMAWHDDILKYLGGNPRRLKRIANTLRVARALASEPTGAGAADNALLFKLTLIGYRNSGAFEYLRRDQDAPQRLQDLADKYSLAEEKRQALPKELEYLAEDTGFWLLMTLEPKLNKQLLDRSGAWF
jgi:hypothetical protein